MRNAQIWDVFSSQQNPLSAFSAANRRSRTSTSLADRIADDDAQPVRVHRRLFRLRRPKEAIPAILHRLLEPAVVRWIWCHRGTVSHLGAVVVAAMCRVESGSPRHFLAFVPVANVSVASSNLVSCSSKTQCPQLVLAAGIRASGVLVTSGHATADRLSGAETAWHSNLVAVERPDVCVSNPSRVRTGDSSRLCSPTATYSSDE